jgi:hypothetical protein
MPIMANTAATISRQMALLMRVIMEELVCPADELISVNGP